MVDRVGVLRLFAPWLVDFVHLGVVVRDVWSVESTPFEDNRLWAVTRAGGALMARHCYASLSYVNCVLSIQRVFWVDASPGGGGLALLPERERLHEW